MADKKYLDYAGLKRTLKHLLPGARKIWHGTRDEWEALPAAERDKYDQAEIASFKKEGQVVEGTFTPNAIPGITITPVDNVDASHSYWRVGNLLVVNYSCILSGTYTGEPNWVKLYDPNSMIDTTKERLVPQAPYFVQIGSYYEAEQQVARQLSRLIDGHKISFQAGMVVNNEVDYQAVYYVIPKE